MQITVLGSRGCLGELDPDTSKWQKLQWQALLLESPTFWGSRIHRKQKSFQQALASYISFTEITYPEPI